MTSINAIKFNREQGAMICDEQRGWNEEDMVIMTADKIKPVTDPEVEQKLRFVASYGNTGTSSIGDELKFKIRQAVSDRFRKLLRVKGDKAEHLMTIEDLANLAFSIQSELKHRHIDETLRGRYGFTTRDFINGSYTKEGKKIEITQPDIVSKVHGDITWKGRSGDMTPIFLNGGIIAGYEPKEGFRIFHLSLIEQLCEPVNEIFLNDGSGRDMTMILMTEYVNNLSVPERQGEIPPVEGLFALLKAVNYASQFNLGVGGYFNIILFDGRSEDPAKIRREISDYRSKLASHIVLGTMVGLLDQERAHELLGALIFDNEDFSIVYDRMLSLSSNHTRLVHAIRGYKMH
jgi:hypothetical protein